MADMAYALAFEGQHIQTSGDHVDDVDHLWLGQELDVRYTVENTGDESVPNHYDFLSITDNALIVEYEDWALRDGFDRACDHSFSVPTEALPSGIHWVFVTVDARGTSPTVAARMVVVARDDADRMRLLDELQGA